jgi:glutamate-5-semialdehyde dehydrogenase
MNQLTQQMIKLAKEAKEASHSLARSKRPAKDNFLQIAARLLVERAPEIIEANQRDLSRAKDNGTKGAMLDRLTLTPKRLADLGVALEEIIRLEDPVGVIEKGWLRPNGMAVTKKRIPLGVILMIYEARPNVTIDAAALCIKAGNAIILRGGSEALHSNRALAKILSDALEEAGLDPRAVRYVDTPDRNAIYELLDRADEIDLCIPRGGADLVKAVSQKARMPVLAHERGVCHIYLDDSAEHQMGVEIIENAKVQRPGVCNALETLLVHESEAATFLPLLAARIPQVELRGCEKTCAILTQARPATEEDWYAEYLDLLLAVRVVPSMEEAIAHINKYGSRHTEAIITSDHRRAERFLDEVNSSTVLVNASTRLADGGELGLGAEIGISTTRIHAFGPMGLQELTTTKFVVHGDGQVRK